MSSRIVAEINQHRVNLDKLLTGDSDEISSNEERITDLLKVLNDVPMTIELLKETNVGQTLQDIKNKFPELPIGALAKKVITKWRKDCKDAEGVKKPSSSSSEVEGTYGDIKPRATTQMVNLKKEVVERESVEGKGSLSRAKSYDDDDWNEDHYDRLSDVRRKVCSIQRLLWLSF